jgi:ferredoxin
MAYVINDNCTACGECLQICPNDAISAGVPVYRISPFFCTECVGFAASSQCLEACPADAIEEEASAA